MKSFIPLIILVLFLSGLAIFKHISHFGEDYAVFSNFYIPCEAVTHIISHCTERVPNISVHRDKQELFLVYCSTRMSCERKYDRLLRWVESCRVKNLNGEN